MKKRFYLLLALIMITGFSVSNADASGFGMYGSLGSGSADWHVDGWTDVEAQPPGSLGYPASDFKTDSEHKGGGFVFDTAVAKDKLFNYQLTVGYDAFKNKDRADGTTLSNLRGWVVSNAFGFGIVRTSGFRLWLGPEVRLSWQTGDNRDQVFPQFGKNYDLFGAGIGPALGMNFNFPGNFTIAVKAGYQFISYYGQMETTVMDNYAGVDVHERLAYVNIGFMFRTSDDRF